MRRVTPFTLSQASLAAVALLFVAPFLVPFHYYPIPSFYSEWLAFVLGVTALVALLRRAAWDPLPVPAMAMVPLAFAALILLQSALGRVTYVELATVAVQYLVWAAALIVLGAVLRREFGLPRLVAVLAGSLVLGAVLNSIAALIQHYHDPVDLPFWITGKVDSAVYGNLAQRNHFAAYATLGLVSLGFLFGRGAIGRIAAAMGALLFLVVLALAASRSTFVYLAIACGIAALAFWKTRDGASRRILAFMLLTLPGFLLANGIVTLDIMKPPFGDTVAAMMRIFDTAGGIDERIQVWREAWWMFAQSPWAGLGFGAFPYQHYLYHAGFDVAVTRGESFNHAHNIVLHVAAEMGMAGVLILAAGAVILWRDARRAALDPVNYWLFAVLAVLLIFSLLEYPLWYSYFLGIGAVVLGAAGQTRFELGVPRVGRAAAALMIGAGSVTLASTAVNYRDFEELFFIRGLERPEHADRERFFSIMERLYQEPLLVPYVELAAAYVSPIDPRNLGRQLVVFDRAVRFAPRGPVVYRRALLFALTGERDAARRELAAAYKVHPDDLPAFVTELQDLARSHPAALKPLLELATEKFLHYAASRERAR